VTVTEGPDRGASVVLDGSLPARVLVGQGPACALRLADREVSRRHATLELSAKRVRLTDLDSTNGTFVNGVAIADAFLTGGETVRMGATTLAIERRTSSRPVALPSTGRFGRVVGASTEMRRLYPLCERLAASLVPVIIEGETGTGKEVLAESLHEEGPRAAGPFIVFDCTAVPPNLVESELFGHERGAFTGAISARKGVFEQAHGGTLFIDEIGDLDLALQPKLLRAIEKSEVRRVGGDRTLKVDVRVLVATRRDLDREIARNRFRDDLFHRLAVARIELPPLRKRRGDVAILVSHFCEMLGANRQSIPRDVLVKWEDDAWPGNVRELRNAVSRRLALGDLSAVSESDSEEEVRAPEAEPKANDPFERVLAMSLPLIQARQQVVEEFERRYIQRILAAHGGSVARAAAASGIARRHFQRLRARRG
jgi:DNA-binding NtrC family response regulator